MARPHDYDEEARILFRKLNLPEDGRGSVSNYNPMDVIFQHPRTGARVYVGNHVAAADRALLQRNGVTHIVNCQEASSRNYFEGEPGFFYRRFFISHWRTRRDISNPSVVGAYFGEVFDWVDKAIAQGHSVLIHCLAGAHRAGTTGTAYLMHVANLPATQAIRAAKRMRPAIDPICDFPTLLGFYEKYILSRPH